MFGSSVLEVAIGMVFIYLLVSLVVTAVNEMLAALLRSRSKLLWKGIQAMLETAGADAAAGKSWTTELYAHPLIRSLFPLEAQGKEATSGPKGLGPAYIPADSFAKVLLDITHVTNALLAEWQGKLGARLAVISRDTAKVEQVSLAVGSAVSELTAGLDGAQLRKDLADAAAGWGVQTALAQRQDALNRIIAGIGEGRFGWLKEPLLDVAKNPTNETVMAVARQIPAVQDVQTAAALLAGLKDLQARVAAQQDNPAGALELATSFAESLTGDGARRALQALPPGDLRTVLSRLLDEAQGDLQRFEANVEGWFNQSMDRVSGWYKRNNAWVNLATGAIIVILLNVDSVVVLKHLSTDQSMRNALVAQAETYGKTPPDGVNVSFQGLNNQLKDLQLPIGWMAPGEAGGNAGLEALPTDIETLANVIWFHLFGWLLTAVAVSLGAPFWFDLLNMFMNLRMAGTRPSTDLEKENAGGGDKPAATAG